MPGHRCTPPTDAAVHVASYGDGTGGISPAPWMECSGHGKIILLGEHFVVHGATALAGALASTTTCAVKRSPLLPAGDVAARTPGTPGWTVEDHRPAVPGYKDEKLGEQNQELWQRAGPSACPTLCGNQLAQVLRHLGLDQSLLHDGISISLAGDLIAASGVGASAANAVSLAKALSKEFSLGLDDAAVNAAAYEGMSLLLPPCCEKGYHGNPSGIDNTVSTYGVVCNPSVAPGLIEFTKAPEGMQFVRHTPDSPLRVIIASTGITASTTEVVTDVRRLMQGDPSKFQGLLSQYAQIFSRAKLALSPLSLTELGHAMNANHALLRDLGVSCPPLESLVDTATKAGALGAKLSGAGRGGVMLALCADDSSQKKVLAALQENPDAKQVWLYLLGRD
eukprot:gene9609-1726_t